MLQFSLDNMADLRFYRARTTSDREICKPGSDGAIGCERIANTLGCQFLSSPTDQTGPRGAPLSLGGLDDTIGFRLRRIQLVLSRRFGRAVDHHDLPPGAFPFLALIVANPGASQSDLASAVGVDKSAAVAIFDGLEKDGLARRERSKADRRRHELVATDKGQALLEELLATAHDDERDLLASLSKEELSSLMKTLDRLYRLCVESE